MKQTKDDLQKEVEQLKKEIAGYKLSLQRQIDQKQELAAQWSVLASQDNALMHLIGEMLNIEVKQVDGLPKGARWEDRKVMWGFYQIPDGEELHRNEILSEGYRAIWNIEQEVRQMRKEDGSR
jgi:cell division septum initiation protein DivIVA